MTKKVPLKIARQLLQLINGEILAYSTVKHSLIDELISEGILFKKGRHRQTVQLVNSDALHTYLSNQWQVQDLEQLATLLEQTDVQRADLMKVTGDSKYVQTRSFKGFLVNCYTPIHAHLHGKPTTIVPNPGTFTFIYDYEDFIPDESLTVVGIENAENFRYIERQSTLFANIKPLFLSRYPQSQHKDVIRWLSQIPNSYLHFGDFDLAGIGIYINEYKKHLGNRAQFFVPTSIDHDLKTWGKRDRYHHQSANFDVNAINDTELKNLVKLIHREQKGLDQEFYLSLQ